MSTRVVQWATGAVGKTCLRAVLDSPHLELVGLYVHSDNKAGRDAGDIARRATTGVLATRSLDDILALDADVVLHCPRLQVPYSSHDDEVCALLRSGKNVVTTAGNHYPRAHGPERERLFLDACAAGGTTLYGVGISPGVVGERLALALTGICLDVTGIEIEEVLDASRMPDHDFVFTVMGMGSELDDPRLREGELPTLYGQLYAETIAFVLDRMGVTYEKVVPDHRAVPTPRQLHVTAGTIPAGTVAATEWCWHAIVDGERFLSLSIIWTMDPDLPDYAGRDEWTVRVRGRPGLTMTLDLVDPQEPGLRTTAGQYATAAPAIHAIPAVVAAPPGLFEPPVFAPFSAPGRPGPPLLPIPPAS